MPGDPETPAAPTSDVTFEAQGATKDGVKWTLKTKGRIAIYTVLAVAAGGGLYAAGSVASGIVVAMFALCGVSVMAGFDLAGATNRRVDDELRRNVDEIARLTTERNYLQAQFLKAPKSSKRKEHKG